MAVRRRGTTLAVVDLGSNAVRLQIASVDARGQTSVLAEDRAAVRLGEQVFRTGRLSAAAIARTAMALERFAKLAQRAGAEKVRAVATSAVREASNGGDFIERILRQTGPPCSRGVPLAEPANDDQLRHQSGQALAQADVNLRVGRIPLPQLPADG